MWKEFEKWCFKNYANFIKMLKMSPFIIIFFIAFEFISENKIDDEVDIRIILGYYFLLASIVTFLVRIFWDYVPSIVKSIFIGLGIFAVGILVVLLFSLFFSIGWFDVIIFAVDKKAKGIQLFEIHKNYALLFFAIVGVGLAIWGRINTEKQIELTRRSQNNEVFAKAIEMIGEGKVMSQIGGLQIIFKLMQDEPEVEYIRCINFMASWLQEDFPSNLEERIPYILRRQISEILKFNFKGKDAVIEKYKEQSEKNYWPSLGKINFRNVALENTNLQGSWLFKSNFHKANLSGADLFGANLTEANLSEANLLRANLTVADMSEAKKLTSEQILSAKWYYDIGKGGPPKLPKKLEKQKKIKEWLKNQYEFEIVKGVGLGKILELRKNLDI